MDFFSELSSVIEELSSKTEVDFSVPDLAAYIPSQPEFTTILVYFAVMAGAFLLLGLLGRAFLGKRSGANHTLSCTVGILFIYAVTVTLYTFRPWNLVGLISPMPFAAMSGEKLVIFRFRGAQFSAICGELLSAFVLAFLVNSLDSALPKGKGLISWFFFRFLTVVLSMLAHLAVRWLAAAYLPPDFVRYAPVILLGLLILLLSMGALSFLVGLLLSASNPILGGLCSFLFYNLVGRQLTRAACSTVILAGLVYALERLEITVVSVSQSSLRSLSPLLLILLVLWYIIGHIL